MPMKRYKVPANYRPTPEIVKANPTVKSFSEGQVINQPTQPRQRTNPIPTGSFLAGSGSLVLTPTGSTNITSSSSNIWLPPAPLSVTPPVSPTSVEGGRGTILPTMYYPAPAPLPTSSGSSGSGSGSGRGTTSATSALPQTPTLGIGNDIYKGMTWRVG